MVSFFTSPISPKSQSHEFIILGEGEQKEPIQDVEDQDVS